MISIKKYLDSTEKEWEAVVGAPAADLPEAILNLYRSALLEMGDCSLEACPGMGDELKRNLGELRRGVSQQMSPETLRGTECAVREELREWGRGTARHYQQRANEVKEMLLLMARTAESVGARDRRSAEQLSIVTQRLQAVASLDDLSQVRASIERSARELKLSIERMTEEGKVVVNRLREQVASYEAKLEEAEQMASRDSLTGLHSRLYIEGQIERRIAGGKPFCVAIVDIDRFKKVNDENGHLAGDELLKQFGAELRSACRKGDEVGRWGGDEFIVLFDCTMEEAEAHRERLREWICGSYSVESRHSVLKLNVGASIGLAAHVSGEEMEELLARADSAMYEQKKIARKTAAR